MLGTFHLLVRRLLGHDQAHLFLARRCGLPILILRFDWRSLGLSCLVGNVGFQVVEAEDARRDRVLLQSGFELHLVVDIVDELVLG